MFIILSHQQEIPKDLMTMKITANIEKQNKKMQNIVQEEKVEAI